MWHQGTMLCLMDVSLHFYPTAYQGTVCPLCAVKLEKVYQEGNCQLLPCFVSHLYNPFSFSRLLLERFCGSLILLHMPLPWLFHPRWSI